MNFKEMFKFTHAAVYRYFKFKNLYMHTNDLMLTMDLVYTLSCLILTILGRRYCYIYLIDEDTEG